MEIYGTTNGLFLDSFLVLCLDYNHWYERDSYESLELILDTRVLSTSSIIKNLLNCKNYIFEYRFQFTYSTIHILFDFRIIILEKWENEFELYKKEKKIIFISILLLVPAQEIGFSSISIFVTNSFESFIQRLYSLDHFYRRIKVNKVRSFASR